MKSFVKKNNILQKLAEKWKKDRHWTNLSIDSLDNLPNKNYIVSLKIDGELCCFYYKNGELILSSRHGKIRTDLPFEKELKNKLKDITLIGFGELYVVDENNKILPYTQAMSILRKPDEKTEKLIRLQVFDLYKINEQKIYNKPYLERIKILKKLFGDEGKVTSSKFYELSIDEIKKIFKQKVLANEVEGLVVWDEKKVYKIKKFINIDAVVIYVKKSRKHPNLMGSLGLALIKDNKYFFIGEVGTGFDKKDRIKWMDIAKKEKVKKENEIIYIKPKYVIEVNAKEINKGENPVYNRNYEIIDSFNFGSLREPSFVRMRGDKAANERDVSLTQISKELLYKKGSFNKISAFELNSFQIRIEGELKEKIISFVKRNFLTSKLFYNPDYYIYGKVLNPHITLGFVKKTTLDDIVNILKQKGVNSINVELGKINKFSSSKYDVIYIEVKGDIYEINNIIVSKEKIENLFPFKGHITLAYVQPNSHDFLIGSPKFEGIRYSTSILEYSSHNPKEGSSFYNLKNDRKGKIVDFLYGHRNVNIEELKGKNVGIDFDHTLISNLSYMKEIIDEIRKNGGKVYIISARPKKYMNEISEFLSKYNIEVDGIELFPYNYSEEDIINDKQKQNEIISYKLNKIKELNIQAFFDDQYKIINHLPNEIIAYQVPSMRETIKYGKILYQNKNYDFLKFEDIINKLNYIANKYGYKIYGVGGYVRDILLGRPTKDLDILVIKEEEGVNAAINFAKHFVEEFKGETNI